MYPTACVLRRGLGKLWWSMPIAQAASVGVGSTATTNMPTSSQSRLVRTCLACASQDALVCVPRSANMIETRRTTSGRSAAEARRAGPTEPSAGSCGRIRRDGTTIRLAVRRTAGEDRRTMRVTLHESTRLGYATDSLAGLSVGDALGAEYFVPGNRVDDLLAGVLPTPSWEWTD